MHTLKTKLKMLTETVAFLR